jgi:hypothetical protein
LEPIDLDEDEPNLKDIEYNDLNQSFFDDSQNQNEQKILHNNKIK